MKITRQQANTLFAEQGFASADTWPDAKMQTKLGQAVSRFVPDNFQTEASKALFAKLTEASEKGEAIELDSGTTEEKEEKSAKAEKKPAAKAEKSAKEPKPAAKKAAPAKKAPPPKAEVEKDAFGNRVDTQSAKINSLLGEEWVNEADIIKASKLGDVRVRDHLSILLGQGKVEKESVRRWRLTKEMAKAVKKLAEKN
jgi:DNA-binding transcriptional ArsR family regulator